MFPESAIHEFTSRLSGALLAPGDPEYDATRTVFNATIDRRPALVDHCTNSADVVEAVHFAHLSGAPRIGPLFRYKRGGDVKRVVAEDRALFDDVLKLAEFRGQLIPVGLGAPGQWTHPTSLRGSIMNGADGRPTPPSETASVDAVSPRMPVASIRSARTTNRWGVKGSAPSCGAYRTE